MRRLRRSAACACPSERDADHEIAHHAADTGLTVAAAALAPLGPLSFHWRNRRTGGAGVRSYEHRAPRDRAYWIDR